MKILIKYYLAGEHYCVNIYMGQPDMTMALVGTLRLRKDEFDCLIRGHLGLRDVDCLQIGSDWGDLIIERVL